MNKHYGASHGGGVFIVLLCNTTKVCISLHKIKEFFSVQKRVGNSSLSEFKAFSNIQKID